MSDSSTERRALVICAHDDDEVFGVGGTIRKLADIGVKVTTIVFAVGNEGYAQLDQKDTIVSRRISEREASQRILGTEQCFAYEYHDFDNLDCEDVYRKVIQAVRLVRPHVVFSHLPADYLAHRTLSHVVPEAVWQAGWQCSIELGNPWDVRRLYLFPILELVPTPSHVVDITDTFKAKLKAMKAYHSQIVSISSILNLIEGKARAYGSIIDVEYGEAFVRSQKITVPLRNVMPLLDSLV